MRQHHKTDLVLSPAAGSGLLQSRSGQVREQQWQSRDDKEDGGAVKGKLHSWKHSQCAVTEPEWPQCFGILFPAGREAEVAELSLPAARVLQGSGIFFFCH